jgi:crossover junction endodeoxyribonuclease RuvC
MTKVVGLDPSFSGFGVAILNNNQNNLLTKTITSNRTDVERLIEIRDQIRGYVRGANLVCIEDFAFSRPNQAHNLGGLGWIIRVMLHEENIPFVVVGTGQVKKFATGKGNAKKPEVMIGIFKRWGVEFADDNEADAFVLMKIAEVLVAGEWSEEFEQLPKFQQQVIQEILKTKAKRGQKNRGKGHSGRQKRSGVVAG